MRFRLTEDWRLGDDGVVPANTVLDFAKSDQWSRRAKGKVIPFTATPLDQEALESLAREYPDAKHLLPGAWV